MPPKANHQWARISWRRGSWRRRTPTMNFSLPALSRALPRIAMPVPTKTSTGRLIPERRRRGTAPRKFILWLPRRRVGSAWSCCKPRSPAKTLPKPTARPCSTSLTPSRPTAQGSPRPAEKTEPSRSLRRAAAPRRDRGGEGSRSLDATQRRRGGRRLPSGHYPCSPSWHLPIGAKGYSREEASTRQPAGFHPEPAGHRRPHVPKTFSDAEVAGLAAGFALNHQERDALAGVVGAAEGRVVAVVGGDDQEILVPKGVEEFREALVEALQVPGHPFRVAPVAVLRVEVHEVGEDQAALDAPEGSEDGVYLRGVVGLPREVLGYALAVEDVPYLADRDHRLAGPFYAVHVRFLRRAYAVVVAVFVLALVGAPSAMVGAGDDALDEDPAFAYEHLVGFPARLVEFFERYHAGVGGDLEDRIGGGVDDPGPGLFLLGAELFDDLRPRPRPVADDPAAGLPLEARDDPLRKALD